MKNNLNKVMGIMCAAAVMLSAMTVNAATTVYELNSSKPHDEINIAQPSDDSAVADRKFVYNDKLYYVTNSPARDDDPDADYTTKIYEANRDGSDPRLISTQTIKGSHGNIELVTKNYVLLNSGAMYIDNELVIDKSTGKAEKSDPYYHIGASQKEYSKAEIPVKHVKEYYLLQGARSDVSPAKIVVFNGNNAKKTTVVKSGWDAKYFGKKIYYISDSKGAFYLGSCSYDGSDNKVISKLQVPENCGYAGIVSISKKGVKYTTLGSNGEKKYTYKF